MKTRISVLLLICTLIFSLVFPQTTSYCSTVIRNNENAERLSQLGLFTGGSSGFELDRKPTRTEAAVMLVRMIGKEYEVESGYYSHPFTDVPAWADHYVGYLYENNLTNGISADLFGSKQFISLNQYMTFVLRALGYSDAEGDFTSSKSLIKAKQVNLLTDDEIAYYSSKDEFLRDDVVGITINALATFLKDSDQSLLDKLIYEDRVVSERAAIDSGFIIDKQVTFEDPALEAVIRELIRKKEGQLFVSDIRNIVEINAERKGITSLEGLQDCKKLKSLFIGFNEITDLEPIRELKFLTTLFVRYNKISNVDALGNLSNLNNLDMTGNKVTDIKPLESLTELQFLGLGNNFVKDISPISNLTNLEELSLLDLDLDNIKPLEKLTKLRWLNLDLNNISDLSPVSNMKDLYHLTFFFNKVRDITPLSGLTNLKTLKLGVNPISDFRPIKDIYDQLEEKDFTMK